MTKSKPSTRRRFFLRFGSVMFTFTVLCLLLVAFAPQPNTAVALREKTATPTAGPSPTPEPLGYCGSIKVNVEFRGVQEVGNKFKPIIGIHIRDDRDHDCDGIPDSWDNCPHVANPDQAPSNEGSYGAACLPESGYRLTNRASEIVIYQMDNGSLHLYSPEGEKLGELSSDGMMQINPSLTVQQVVGRTYVIGYIDAAGQFRSTRFQSNALTFGLMDIKMVVVGPEAVELRPGETAQFFATGLQETGIQLWFMPRWSATGGTVNQQGLYTAGGVPGNYTVTACRISSVCGSATVRIVQ